MASKASILCLPHAVDKDQLTPVRQLLIGNWHWNSLTILDTRSVKDILVLQLIQPTRCTHSKTTNANHQYQYDE